MSADAPDAHTLGMLADLARSWTVTIDNTRRDGSVRLNVDNGTGCSITYRRPTLAAAIRAAWAGEPA